MKISDATKEFSGWLLTAVILIALLLFSLYNVGYKTGYSDGYAFGIDETVNMFERTMNNEQP